ncbi:MAG: hypothetical protein WD448_03795 [Woeseia sp.]
MLLIAAALLLLLALVKPTMTLPRDTWDFMFVLDITGSMNVADAGSGDANVTRLDFARQLAGKALEEMRCGSRAGLAVFTEHRSFLLFAPIEVCDNHLVISTMLQRIDWRMAWAERSEVAKGLYSGIEAVQALEVMDEAGRAGDTRLVFMTDGHEAPPVHPALRPKFRGRAGITEGLVAGIGGSTPAPIPWFDENGEAAGYWARDEVMQVDRHSLGRPSTQGEAMAGVDSADLQERIASGTEHLSSLRESYLRQLAAETGLEYVRATTGETFSRALLDTRFATKRPVLTNVAWIPATLSLLCVLYLFTTRLHSRIRRLHPRFTAERARAGSWRRADSPRGDAAPRPHVRRR